jgi:MEMO1 family protein
MRVRTPIAAGRFYPSDAAECRHVLDQLLAGLEPVAAVGAIAPHAGWIYSGRTAARSIVSIAAGHPDTVIVFGAVHVMMRAETSMYGEGAWETPLGTVEVDAELAGRLALVSGVHADPEAHRFEHSIEVLLPILHQVLPSARIVPLMVGPGPRADGLGRECARAAAEFGRRVAYLASTDLTHYGAVFGFEPAGRGTCGVKWAKDVNDRRLIELIAAGQAEAVVPESVAHRNACGAGAVAAILGAMSQIGAGAFRELEHISSADVERAAGGGIPATSVGYLAGVFSINPS